MDAPNAKDGKRNGKRNGKSRKIVHRKGNGRDSKGAYLAGHKADIAPLQNVGAPPTRKITAALLRIGDEEVDAADPKTGKPIKVPRYEVLARQVFDDAVGSGSAMITTHARDFVGRRIDPEPEEVEHTLIPVNQEIHAPLTINILQQLQDQKGGHPTTRDVLDKLAEVPVTWHHNGEAEDAKGT